MGEKIYKIGEVASMLTTSVRTIRYYEEESLIKPMRTKKGTRLYSKSHVKRLRAILKLSQNGFSIETIRQIGNLRKQCTTGRESSHLLSALLNDTVSNLEQQIQALEKIKAEIQSTQKVIKTCHECDNYPSTQGCPNCLVIQKKDEVILLNLVWDVGC